MPAQPPFSEALRFWLKLGFISFGGPTGQIAVMHTELVDRRRWIGEQRYLHALNYCMLLPGPEATQLATYCGWLLHGTWGGIAAGTLFVLPSAFLLWALSVAYVSYGSIGWVAAVFAGLQPAVTAIVAAATLRIGKRTLRHPALWAIAFAAFVGIFFLNIPFPAIIGAAALIGFLGGRRWPRVFDGPAAAPAGGAESVISDSAAVRTVAPSLARSLRVSAVCLALWAAPLLALAGWLGIGSTPVQQGLFFSKAAMVTFGGAYAVLPYVGQQAVERHGWLSSEQMLDGLAMAETTPGPLIMVVQFVGFLGGWQHPGGLPPLLAATLCAAITTWTTFVPCFYWIFLGAPFIERMRGNQRVTQTLNAVTAAVVGVIANLAVWFAGHTLFPGLKESGAGEAAAGPLVDGFAVAVAVAAFVALQRFRLGVIPVIALAAVLGLARHVFA